MSNTVTVTAPSFATDVINSDKPVLVDFWASWCGPCIQVAPILDKIAEENKDKLTIAKVDVDANQELAARFGISSIPTLLLFEKGEITKVLVGARSKDALEQELVSVLG